MKREESYLKRFKKYGVDPRTLKWQSQKAAEQRYREIVSLAALEGKDILDVGSGFGAIIPFIASSVKTFSYTGIDIIAEFIAAAGKIYPQHTFSQGDYFAKPLEKKFDIIIANGSLNTNLKDNLAFRKKAIKTMYAHAKETVIFNMAGGYPQPKTAKGSNIWFADAKEIEKFCKTISTQVTLLNHPGRREFSVVMAR
jgi:SAM-dependent methyltransferase